MTSLFAKDLNSYKFKVKQLKTNMRRKEFPITDIMRQNSYFPLKDTIDRNLKG